MIPYRLKDMGWGQLRSLKIQYGICKFGKAQFFAISFAFCLVVLWGMPEAANANKRPSSIRSRQAVERQRPALIKDLHTNGITWGAPVFIRIFKEEKQLEVWLKQGNRFKHFRSYPICTYGGKGLGPKMQEGDGQAPEGFYFVTPMQMNPYSRFHLAFNLGYPNAYDRCHKRTGSALMVHGSCVSIGCFAMTDDAIEEIYALAEAALDNGQPFFRVHIFPFRMTDKKMQRHRRSRWIKFWRNLKVGYDGFALNEWIPPNVVVHKGQYLFDIVRKIE